MNVGKSKILRCSRYANVGRIYLNRNGETLVEVYCFKYLGSQVAADGGCQRDILQRITEGKQRGES